MADSDEPNAPVVDDDDDRTEAEPDAGEDEVDPDADEAEAEQAGEAAPEAAARRRSLGPTMLLLGAGLWAVAGTLRCAGPAGPEAAVTLETPGDEADEAAVDPEAAIADEPADARGDDAAVADDDEAGAVAMADDIDGPDAPPEEDEDLAPLAPADWSAAEPPEVVHYEIRRGGTAKTVANLYKIFHHEMTALNPGVDLDRELPPGTKLVVYRREGDEVSQSVGMPSAGSLEGGVPMVAGRGRELKAIPWKSYGSAHTVATLDKILDQWALRGHEQPVLVGNMSARKGGRLEPHSTHQSGRDVDLSYPQRLAAGEEFNWREMTKDNLDASETWKLLELLRESGTVEMVFIDRGIQKLLYDWAVTEGGKTKREVGRWMEYPRPAPVSGAFIQHVPGHTDHFHVRFACTAAERKCSSRER